MRELINRAGSFDFGAAVGSYATQASMTQTGVFD
jgi:hypothetical protein